MMDLSPEQRETGKRGFVDAIRGIVHGPAGTVNRRAKDTRSLLRALTP